MFKSAMMSEDSSKKENKVEEEQNQLRLFDEVLNTAIYNIEVFMSKIYDFDYHNSPDVDITLTRYRRENDLLLTSTKSILDNVDISSISQDNLEIIEEHKKDIYDILLYLKAYLAEPTKWENLDAYLDAMQKQLEEEDLNTSV